MPKLLFARPPVDAVEERKIRKLAGARHAPADWIRRAQVIALSWDGLRVPAIAAALGCNQKAVRHRLARFAVDGLDGLGDRPGAGRRPRISQDQRSRLIALVASPPPGRLVRFEAELADAGLTLLRRPRRGEPDRPGASLVTPLRQTIESIFDTLKGQLDLELHGGHTPAGVLIRVLQRLLALTAAIWHNDHTGQPVRRSLLAYDH